MNFTREEAKKDIAKTLSVQYRITESTFNYVYNNIDKLSDSYEAQLKAKDTAIELLESMCNLGLETQNKYSRIVKAKDEEIEKLKVENKKYMEHITLKHLSDTIVFCASCSEKIIMLKENNE